MTRSKGNNNFLSMDYYFVIQILVALGLGVLVGWQRQRWGKSAGPRTYAFVTMAATLATRLSMDATDFGDPSRIAAQILPAVGFLGAGMILHKKQAIEGLTTAASVWAMAAVGMAIGYGWIWQSVFVTILMFLLLTWDDKLDRVDKK